MSDAICSIDGCTNRAEKRGWCPKHYRRWHRHGDPLGGGVPRFRDPEDTFLARVEKGPSCHLWTGALNDQGYGRLRVDGDLVRAHRYAWERANGPIPDGLYVDHICHNRACVNADHLRLATHSQNESNRSGATSRSRLGIRNVIRDGNGYTVSVTRGSTKHWAHFLSLDDAVRDAEQARARLFGEFSGGA